jgi:hypothetical protein
MYLLLKTLEDVVIIPTARRDKRGKKIHCNNSFQQLLKKEKVQITSTLDCN